MARPRKVIDKAQLEQLAAIGCTSEEMASILDCSKDTLERRFAAVIKKGRDRAKMSLRRAQYTAALGRPAVIQNGVVVTPAAPPNITMQIWLGKQMLEQKDKIESTQKTDKLDELIAAMKG